MVIATSSKLSTHSHSSPILHAMIPLVLSGLPTAAVASTLTFKASSKVNLLNDDTYQWDCATNYVILRTNRAKCALNKEILDLLNEEAFWSV